MAAGMLEYIKRNPDKYLGLIAEHISISLQVIIIAVSAGFLLAVTTYRSVNLSQWITGGLSVLRIIPSLAVLILIIPVMGTGRQPAVLALTLLALPPVYIHGAEALQNVPAAVMEAAEGMGMGRQRGFWTIRLPLALPEILTGIRICSIEVIASAAIAAYIGAGGIGTILLTGLNLYRTDMLMLGGLTAAGIALLADLAFTLIQRRVLAYQRK